MSNVQRRLKNVEGRYNVPACGRQAKYKVGIRIGIEVLVFKDLGTLYLVLRTTFSVLLLDTSYLILLTSSPSLEASCDS